MAIRDIDTIDYSRGLFDMTWAYAANASVENNTLDMVKCLSEMDTLIAIAYMEAHHENAYRLRGKVEPIDNPAF